MKKKHFIGLSTLLLVLLLGCFSTSYALTENGFKNLMYNYAVNQNEYTDSQAKTFAETIYTSFDGYYNYMTDSYYWFVCFDYNALKFWVEPVSSYATSNTKKATYGSNFAPVSYDGIYFQYTTTAGRFSTNSGKTMNHVSTASSIFYTEQDLYNTSYNTILYAAPYNSPSWFTSSGTYDVNFSYVYNPAFQNVTVQDLLAQDVQMKAITYSDIYYDNDYLCVFGDFDQLDHVYLAYYKYNRYSGQWEPYQWISPYTNYEKEDNQIRLYFNGNYVANTIICLGFIPKTDDFYAQYAWFYLTGKNTSTSSGIVSPSSYSGDNDVQQQINDNNLQEIKDTLTDDSQVDSMLDEFVSGDLGEKLGYSPLENPFVSFLYNFLTGLCDTLLGTGNVILNFDFHGHVVEVNSSDFTMPSGLLKSVISICLTTCYCFIMYKYFNHLIHKLEIADLNGLKKEFSQEDDSNLM